VLVLDERPASLFFVLAPVVAMIALGRVAVCRGGCFD
jgi:hypothetical protein